MITDSHPLTLFNFCGLLVVILATFVYKIVLGKAPPPTFKGRLMMDVFYEFVQTGIVAADKVLLVDLVSVSAAALVGAKAILAGVESISLLADFAFKGGEVDIAPHTLTIRATSFRAIMPSGPKLT